MATAPVSPGTEENEMPKEVYDPPPPYSPAHNDPMATATVGAGPAYPSAPGQNHFYPPQQQVIITQPGVAVVPGAVQYSFGAFPVTTFCHYCNRVITTMLRYETGAKTWTIFAILMLCLCWLCAWIPFVSKGTKDVVHSCPNCKAMLGVYRRC